MTASDECRVGAAALAAAHPLDIARERAVLMIVVDLDDSGPIEGMPSGRVSTRALRGALEIAERRRARGEIGADELGGIGRDLGPTAEAGCLVSMALAVPVHVDVEIGAAAGAATPVQ